MSLLFDRAVGLFNESARAYRVDPNSEVQVDIAAILLQQSVETAIDNVFIDLNKNPKGADCNIIQKFKNMGMFYGDSGWYIELSEHIHQIGSWEFSSMGLYHAKRSQYKEIFPIVGKFLQYLTDCQKEPSTDK